VTQVGHQQAPGAQAAETLQRRWEALEQNTDTEADRIRGYYSLRHSYGSQRIERGFKLAYVSRALGHASEAIPPERTSTNSRRSAPRRTTVRRRCWTSSSGERSTVVNHGQQHRRGATGTHRRTSAATVSTAQWSISS
jgi:hypothetical protein